MDIAGDFPATSVLLVIFTIWYTEFDTYKTAFIEAGLPTIAPFFKLCISSLLIAKVSGARFSTGAYCLRPSMVLA
jgi:hypothetical protein